MHKFLGIVVVAVTLEACGILPLAGKEQGAREIGSDVTTNTNVPITLQVSTSPNDLNTTTPLSGGNVVQTTVDANTTVALPEYGGASRCANSNLVLCDGFEGPTAGGQPDPNVWSVVVSDASNTVEVSDTRAARGTRALHIHSPVVGAIGATIRTSQGFPAPNNTIYGRLFMYLDAEQAPGGHSTVVRASGAASNGTNLEQFGGMFHNYVANWGGPGADNGGYSQIPFPVKKWVCLEWAHKGNDAELDVWADGVSIFAMTNNWVAGSQMLQGPQIAYNELDIGWEVYEHFDDDLTTGSYEVYIDEIAVGYQRVGCTL